MDLTAELQNLYDTMEKELGRDMVFGNGNPDSGILFIGEAPGGEEIKRKSPFVGKAGNNLNSFMQSLGITRETSYITNAVKFRPTKISHAGNVVNASPSESDILEFLPYLEKEIKIIRPKIIITLGKVPASAVFTDNKYSISKGHGILVHSDAYDCQVFPLYHPAAIIYNSYLKADYNQDIARLSQILKTIL